jgi:hypothetical protein
MQSPGFVGIDADVLAGSFTVVERERAPLAESVTLDILAPFLS